MSNPNHQRRRNRTFRLELLESRALLSTANDRYYGHGCQSRGNQFDLWAAATKLPLYQATVDFCRRLGGDVPCIRRW